MRLVERHMIKESSKEYKILDELCFKSKNIYNTTLYHIRQEYIKSGTYLSYFSLQKKFQDEKQFDYYAIPSKVSQQTMRMVDQNFRSFFMANVDYKKNPKKYKAKPRIPKVSGRCVSDLFSISRITSSSSKSFAKSSPGVVVAGSSSTIPE